MKNTKILIHDEHNVNSENVMDLLAYMLNVLKIEKDTFNSIDVYDKPGATYVWHEQSTSTVISKKTWIQKML